MEVKFDGVQHGAEISVSTSEKNPKLILDTGDFRIEITLFDYEMQDLANKISEELGKEN